MCVAVFDAPPPLVFLYILSKVEFLYILSKTPTDVCKCTKGDCALDHLVIIAAVMVGDGLEWKLSSTKKSVAATKSFRACWWVFC